MLSVFLATYHTSLLQVTLVLLKKIYKIHDNYITKQLANRGTTPRSQSACCQPSPSLARSAQNEAHMSEAAEGAGASLCQNPF